MLTFMTEERGRGTPTPPGRELCTPPLVDSEADPEVEEEEEHEEEGLLLGCDGEGSTPPPLDPMTLEGAEALPG